jgi:hypothetical protein
MAKFKNVFVLSTGRCGSLTFHHACRHMRNYSSAHETANELKLRQPVPYDTGWPERHIEIDNRLAWYLGLLHRDYGKEAYYVHLVRDREATARSLMKRRGIFLSFATTMMHRPITDFDALSDEARHRIALFFWDTVNANIEMFLADKPHRAFLAIEQPHAAFRSFWNDIGAEGDLDKAVSEFNQRYHAS